MKSTRYQDKSTDKYERLLKAVRAVIAKNKPAFIQMCMVSPEAEKLKKLVDSERRYTWRKLGERWYLYKSEGGVRETESPVCSVDKQSGKLYSATFYNRAHKDRSLTGSLAQVKAQLSELFKPESE